MLWRHVPRSRSEAVPERSAAHRRVRGLPERLDLPRVKFNLVKFSTANLAQCNRPVLDPLLDEAPDLAALRHWFALGSALVARSFSCGSCVGVASAASLGRWVEAVMQ